MSAIALMQFQKDMRDALVRRFANIKNQYDAATESNDANATTLTRKKHGAVLLQAPTGVGKTLIAVETVRDFSTIENIIWFWFVPFTSLINQTENTFRNQAPGQKLLSLESNRHVEALRPGGTYVISWQSVSATRAETRIVRQVRDEGLSVDELIAGAREAGYRIGCVVDEAHHGFKRAPQSTAFFNDVLKPDYALLMTATPRDSDAILFSSRTGYELGAAETWPTISREQGVTAGLLKTDVKTVRFIAGAGVESRIVDFERLALSQACVMHRAIKKELADVGITPLMLVQVPNGEAAAKDAEKILVNELGFAPEQVRTHTADEPDEHLAAIANDPVAEVLIFKTAIAMGFDAPRAFTLAALRGVRDSAFGVQVVGRIMRVHRLLQGRSDTSPILSSGYVFLANEEDQEGLRTAADLINELEAQEPQIGPQTVITVSLGPQSTIQFVSDGESVELPIGSDATDVSEQASSIGVAENVAMQASEIGRMFANEEFSLTADSSLPAKHDSESASDDEQPAAVSLITQLPGGGIAGALASGAKPTIKSYNRRPNTANKLKTEVLPMLPDDVEERIISAIDFGPVLVDRDRASTRVTQRMEGLFGEDEPIDEKVLARLSAPIIAARAKQIALPFEDVDQRDFLGLLEKRFTDALINAGIEPPADKETLRRQLDLVLVRNPKLIREAHRRVRASLIEVAEVEVPSTLEATTKLSKSAKNVYGVFPPGLTTDEKQFSQILDTDSDVVWWHRNPSQQATSVALFGWSGGLHGFFPDFVIAVKDRAEALGPALVEVKGEHLQEWEKAKAGARHAVYGRVFMVGKRGDDGAFRFMRLEHHSLELDGTFETQRLRFDH
jgi:hypothetical protein